ncbi:uncharacterized protein [Typha angustifolia]|uniref:uncharacterized protein n=1 Tax=Typha angustifolia TaxID=59011 RepID=UPI003C2F90DC
MSPFNPRRSSFLRLLYQTKFVKPTPMSIGGRLRSIRPPIISILPRSSSSRHASSSASAFPSPTQNPCEILLRSLISSSDTGHRAETISRLRSEPTTCSAIFSAVSDRARPLDNDTVDLLFDLAKNRIFPSNSFHFTQLTNKLCYNGFVSKAWDFLHAVNDAGGAIETSACNALLAGLARDRDFSRMNKLFSEMKDMGVRPNVVTYGILINHLCKSRCLDDALQVLDVMTRPESEVKPDVVTFNTVVDGFCKVGRLDDGLTLLGQMKTQHSCDPNTITYNCLIDGFCKVGDIDMAHELVNRMEQEGVQPSVVTLNTLVSGMCKSGCVGGALEFFRKKRLAWAEVKGNAVTYSTLIGAFLHCNNMGKAMDLFDEMVREGHAPDSVTYFTMISGLTQMGRLEDACSFASTMRNSGFRLDIKSYNTLISGFCKKKRLDKAHELVREMKEVNLRPDVCTYNTLMAALCKAGDFAAVRELLSKMIDEGCELSVVTYGTLIHGYCKTGNLDEALKIFQSMAKSAVPPNTVIYNSLIDSLCKNGKIDFAVSLMDEMREKSIPPNVTTYNALLKGLRDRNMSEKAFELMDQMKEQRCTPDYVTMDILTEWLSVIGDMDRLRWFVQGNDGTIFHGKQFSTREP